MKDPIEWLEENKQIIRDLQSGEYIKYVFRNVSNSSTRFLLRIVIDEDGIFFEDDEGNYWQNITPIKKTKYILPPERVFAEGIKRELKFNEQGIFYNEEESIDPGMFQYLGKKLEGEADEWYWPDWAIEEREE